MNLDKRGPCNFDFVLYKSFFYIKEVAKHVASKLKFIYVQSPNTIINIMKNLLYMDVKQYKYSCFIKSVFSRQHFANLIARIAEETLIL